MYKYKSLVSRVLSIATLVLVLNTPMQQASAGMVIGAANGCFPRVFSQINQFKVSSGGLLNENANPRSIVCSLDNNQSVNNGDNDDSDGSIEGYIHSDNLTGEMECTTYARDTLTGALIDSGTVFLAEGLNGDIGFESVENLTDTDEYYMVTYLQCKVPGGTRIFHLELYPYNSSGGGGAVLVGGA